MCFGPLFGDEGFDITRISVSDIRLHADFKDVRFKQMHFEQVNGRLLIADGKVDMTNFSMNTLGGSVVMNGTYATTDATKPLLKGDFQ